MSWREAARTLAVDFTRVAIVSVVDLVRRLDSGAAAKTSGCEAKSTILDQYLASCQNHSSTLSRQVVDCEIRRSNECHSIWSVIFFALLCLVLGLILGFWFGRFKQEVPSTPLAGRPVTLVTKKKGGVGHLVSSDESGGTSSEELAAARLRARSIHQ